MRLTRFRVETLVNLLSCHPSPRWEEPQASSPAFSTRGPRRRREAGSVGRVAELADVTVAALL
jgi:hypothetical protein